MNILELISQATLIADAKIDVYSSEVNECMITIDLIHEKIAPVAGTLGFQSLVEIPLDVGDKRLLMQAIKDHVFSNMIGFTPYASDELKEQYRQGKIKKDWFLTLTDTHETPYSVEVNQLLNKCILKKLEENFFEITFV